MQNYNSLTRWLFIMASIFIVGLILWNTYSFFNQLKENEREKMQIWAAAQTELQNDNKDAVVSETALEVIRSNTTTPMLVYSHKEGVYTGRNRCQRSARCRRRCE